MEPVPGYPAASWRQGYGDFVLKPDLATLRRSPGCRRRRWCSPTSSIITATTIPHSPRAMLKRQIARLAAADMKAYFRLGTGILPVRRELQAIQRQTTATPRPPATTSRTITSSRRPRKSRSCGRSATACTARACRWRTPRANGAPDRKRSTSATPRRWTWPTATCIIKNGVKEIASRPARPSPSWPSGATISPARRATSTPRCGTRPAARRCSSIPRRRTACRALMRHYLAGQLAHAREITYFLAPFINSYKRFQVGTFAPTRAVWSVDNRTAGFRLCGEGRKAIRDRVPRRRRRPQPLPRLRRADRRGPRRDRARSWSWSRRSSATRTRRAMREIPRTLREATQTLRGSKMLRAAFGEPSSITTSTPRDWEQIGIRPPRHRLGAAARLRARVGAVTRPRPPR